MALSDGEKEQIRKESLDKKAKGYALKIHDHPDSTEKLVQELMAEVPNDLEELKKLVWNHLVFKIQNDHNLTSFMDLIQKLSFAPPKENVLDKYRFLIKEAQKDKTKDRKHLIEKEKKKLADFGISGPAVVPKISADSEDQGVNALLEKMKSELFW